MAGRAKELRVGLVCYGGSSLAIYMHGITKEINRLVTASAARAAGIPTSTPTETVYADLLDELASSGSSDLRVLVDVIAGTSAGGINGIFLGKALAGNRSQDALRDVWFNRGDMNQLVVGPRKIAGIPISWKTKVPYLLGRALSRSPLRGDAMARWLHEALQAMDATPRGPSAPASLLPPGHPLELYVTITDFYGYQRLIPLARPKFVPDPRHRHALNFRYRSSGPDDFGDNAGLAFAARTTSCFPAVFPAVNPEHFARAVGGSLSPLLDRCFRIYRLSGADPSKTYFVDGGVLDNKPFGWAIDTIVHARPADSEVDRRLLYIEPDPGSFAREEGGKDPETLAAALGALSRIPRAEPILDDLLQVEQHNERVGRIRDLIEASFDRVASSVQGLVPDEILSGQPPAEWPWTDWNNAVHTIAIDDAGMAYAIYLRLKISNVLDGFARSICAICNYPHESDHAQLVRTAIHAWGRNSGLYQGVHRQPATIPADRRTAEAAPGQPLAPTADQIRFLRAFDLGFMRRRLRFVIAAFNWWYGAAGAEGFPTREDLDEGKAILYQNIATLDALAELRILDGAQPDVQKADELRGLVRDTFPEAQLSAFLAGNGADGALYAHSQTDRFATLFEAAATLLGEQLRAFAPALLTQLAPLTASWAIERRRDLVVRYLGFPIWDLLLYPVQALSQIGEADEIDVMRISPHEATLLPVPPGGKVEGVRTHHFYAFFSREARENDYLWGRLDAAEQLVRLLLDSAKSGEPLEAWCKRAFAAVLDEEQPSLTSVQSKTADLRAAVDAL